MKYQKVIVFSLVIIIIGIATSLFNSVEQTDLQTQSVTIGTVIYKVTPKTVTQSAATWEFEVVLNTHTGELDQDLTQFIRMVDDEGNQYQATKWEGDLPGGHHREGTLKFSPITPRPAFIKLNIQTTDSTGKISLRWNLGGR